jgi:predicted 3-demethylubiquinone-9 3-methyltransferase (glyoxalase superfamily)
MAIKHKIIPHLWFDKNAEDAVNFYISLFDDSKITNIARYGDAGPGPKGSVMSISFVLNGQEFAAINGGPVFQFNEAISFLIWCDTQAEIDALWGNWRTAASPTSAVG